IQLSNNRPLKQSNLRRQPSISQTKIRPKSAFANLNDHQPLEKQSSQNQTSSRTKNTVASSAAALVSDTAYRQTNFIRQLPMSEICHFFHGASPHLYSKAMVSSDYREI
ncbi:hypothetical protein MUU53_11410, partial [Rhizobium lemnae]|uniref:hypothetical protein n=1 Tax=Rhizobium lemnae TaxID=1214924 RepID=UPI001FF2CD92